VRRSFITFAALSFLAASPAHAVMEDYPSVKLQGLDKSVGRTVTFEATVGSTIQYGPLFIKIHACRKAPPIEKPESAAFLQIWEVPPGEEKSEWVFSGWMFASSPALSAMDHPVYDVWVLDCLGKEEPNAEAAAAETAIEADQSTLPAADSSAADMPAETPAPETESFLSDEPLAPDSEAEDQTQREALPSGDSAPPLPGDDDTAASVSPALPAPQTPQSAEDDGFTAYDLMR
jgi:hypothetical protein